MFRDEEVDRTIFQAENGLLLMTRHLLREGQILLMLQNEGI
jgi:hypothetical protein